jgi:ADP-dependent phosphofructokinase/glucokinase
MESILETLYDHFKLIMLTGFDHLVRTNPNQKSAKDLLATSNDELANLEKTLKLLIIDDEDVRHGTFVMIYGML